MARYVSCAAAALVVQVGGRVWDFEADMKAVAGNRLYDKHNGAKMNETLAQLAPGDVFVIPNKTFHVMGGIQATGLKDVIIQIDGTLAFSENIKAWPRKNAGGSVTECIEMWDLTNVTFTSSGKGTLDGHGHKWWGIPGIGYLIREENRPRLLHIHNGKNLLVENLFFKNSPYWTFTADDNDGLEIRNSEIDARRTSADGHTLIDMTAFNTDGFDVSGKNVWIHDCTVWNQDDSVCVKGTSENMLFERIHASGVGLTVGSIGSGHHVRNITFRDCTMHNSYKGIYMKFRGSGLVEDVTYENIVMDSPSQTPIWIGPAQQSDSREFWEGHPCSLLWPQVPGSSCHVPDDGKYVNILLRNITINNPKEGPGLIYGNATNPMQNITFDNVVVNNPGSKPFGDNYFCEGVQGGVALGNTNPVPPCFEDRTTKATAATVV